MSTDDGSDGPSYDVVLSPAADRSLDQLPQSMRERVVAALDELAHERNTGSHPKVSPRKFDDGYRLRVGDVRVLFRREKPRLVVDKIGHRSTVYDREE